MNSKGFTLVELLAVIVILGIIMAFTYPNVVSLIEKNKNDNYEQLKESIESAAKSYISDYRYEISVDGTSIKKVGSYEITDNKILVSYLVDDGKLTLDKDGSIKDPRDNGKCLNFSSSYVIVTFDSVKRDYVFNNVEDSNLVFQNCE